MRMEDYDRVHRLWTATVEKGMRPLDDSREGVEAYLRRNPNTSFVAEESGGIVGAVLCGHDGRRGYLYHMAVAPQLQRKGIGKALTAAALEALRGEGIRKAAVVVFSANDTGNVFWESAGFSPRDDLVYRNRDLTEND